MARRIDGEYKTRHKVNEHGLLMPRLAKGKKVKGMRSTVDDFGFATYGMRSPLYGGRSADAIGIGGSVTREEELRAIEEFAEKVGITFCPPGACRGAYKKDEQPQVMRDRLLFNQWPFFPVAIFTVQEREVDFVGVRTKRLAKEGKTFRRRVMASEHVLCPVCDRMFPERTKKKCPDCGHDMRRKRATKKEVDVWLKKFGELPLARRVYRGFTYDDLRRLSLEPSQANPTFTEYANAFNRLFPASMAMKGNEDWMKLMVAYELQRRLVYPMGEPALVKERRVSIRRGKIPRDLLEIINAKNKAKEERTMAKKVKKVKKASEGSTKTRVIDCMGYPVTAVVRWFGHNGYTTSQAMAVFEEMGIPVKRSTVALSIKIGRDGELNGKKFEPAPLTKKQEKELRDVLKEVDPENTKPKSQAEPKKKKAGKKKADVEEPAKVKKVKGKKKKVAKKKPPRKLKKK